MKTKTALTTLALAGAFIASTAVVEANLIPLTVTSGTQTLTGVYDPITGAYTASGAFSDGWKVSVTTASLTEGPLNIDISSQDKTSSTKTISPITIDYNAVISPTASGAWLFELGGSQAVPNDVTYTDSVYENGSATAFASLSGFGTKTGSITGLSTFGEVIVITPTVNGPQNVSLDSSFTVTPVPDSSTTLVLLGSALIGIGGLRSKFGSKRA